MFILCFAFVLLSFLVFSYKALVLLLHKALAAGSFILSFFFFYDTGVDDSVVIIL